METNNTSDAANVYPTAQEIVNNHQRLAYKVARRLHAFTVNTGAMQTEDLVQIALMAMIKAGESYDPSKSAWTTHAYRHALGECLRAARKAPIVRGRLDRGTIQEQSVSVVSLDAPRSSGDDGETDNLYNTLADPSFQDQASGTGVMDYIRSRVRMNARETVIFEQRLVAEPEDKKTLTEVGTILGMTAARVQQLEKALIERMRKCCAR